MLGGLFFVAPPWGPVIPNKDIKFLVPAEHYRNRSSVVLLSWTS